MKKIIIITGMPGVGKTTLGKALAKTINAAFLDKDTVSDKFTNLITKNVTHEHDKESDFYRSEVRDLEYEVTMDIAIEQINYINNVIVVGPFTKELKDNLIFFEKYKKNNINVEFHFFNIICNKEENKRRIKIRNLPEDKMKLDDWKNYSKRRKDIKLNKNVLIIKNDEVSLAINKILRIIKI